MKIINNKTTKEFLELTEGTVFEYAGTFYMKLQINTGWDINAVCLANGNVASFNLSDLVVPKENSELIIK